MNTDNKKTLRENYNKVQEKKVLGKTKGVSWKRKLRNKSI